jgi:hypothetical protein
MCMHTSRFGPMLPCHPFSVLARLLALLLVRYVRNLLAQFACAIYLRTSCPHCYSATLLAATAYVQALTVDYSRCRRQPSLCTRVYELDGGNLQDPRSQLLLASLSIYVWAHLAPACPAIHDQAAYTQLRCTVSQTHIYAVPCTVKWCCYCVLDVRDTSVIRVVSSDVPPAPRCRRPGHRLVSGEITN